MKIKSKRVSAVKYWAVLVFLIFFCNKTMSVSMLPKTPKVMHMCIRMFLKIVRIKDVIGPTSSAVLDAILEKKMSN